MVPRLNVIAVVGCRRGVKAKALKFLFRTEVRLQQLGTREERGICSRASEDRGRIRFHAGPVGTVAEVRKAVRISPVDRIPPAEGISVPEIPRITPDPDRV